MISFSTFEFLEFSTHNRILSLLAIILSACCFYYCKFYYCKSSDIQHSRLMLFGFAVCSVFTIVSGNWLSYLIFAELSVLFLYGLIVKTKPFVANRYFAAQLLAATFIMMAVAELIARTGATHFGSESWLSYLLLTFGLGIKTSLIGLHFWLPKAHSLAPAPASAILSGFSVKLGAVGFLRLITEPNTTLIYMGLVMAIFGAVHAIISVNIKRLLAYSTVSQLGLIITAISTGQNGHNTAILLIITHAIFKTSLFLIAGLTSNKTEKLDIESFAGCIKNSRTITAVMTIFSMTIVGLPFTSGFINKTLLKQVSIETIEHNHASFLFFIASIGTVIYIAKIWQLALTIKTQKPYTNAFPKELKRLFLILSVCLLSFGIYISVMYYGEIKNFTYYIEPLLPLTVAIIILHFIRKVKFSENLPDIDNLVDILINGFLRLAIILKEFHNGDLLRYLKVIVVGIALLLSILIRTGGII